MMPQKQGNQFGDENSRVMLTKPEERFISQPVLQPRQRSRSREREKNSYRRD
jgi:hypothetical protein